MNKSYLHVTGHDVVYPSLLPDFDPKRDMTAFDTYGVPLLWLAMFRPAQLRAATVDFNPPHAQVEPDPEDYEGVEEFFTPDQDPGPLLVDVVAPVAARGTALAQLDAAVPVLDRLFDATLAEHAALLRAAVEAMPGSHVTIELVEIAGMSNAPEGFYERLREGLAALDGPAHPAADRDRLATLSQLRLHRPLPPARLLLDRPADPAERAKRKNKLHRDDVWNLSRLLGTQFWRPVPWEPDPGPPPEGL